jgi:tRNA G10  N-methylase Trm11
LTQEQRRQIISDQLRETPGRSNRWVGRQLGVHHATVAAVRSGLESTGQIIQCATRLGADNRTQPARRSEMVGGIVEIDGNGISSDRLARVTEEVEIPNRDEPSLTADSRLPLPFNTKRAMIRPDAERLTRLEATTLIHGDCRSELRKLPAASVDAIITDPIYPEVGREYGRISEADWHEMMRSVVAEGRRVLKTCGSMLVIIQPNYDRVGRMRLWPWEFVAWAGRDWNLIQVAYWWAVDAMPLTGTDRRIGLMRQSVKMCIWLGSPDCYRNQDNVL